MDRLKSALLGVNLAYLLTLALMVKALVNTISYPDFLITIPILSYEGYKLYTKHKHPSPMVLDAEVRRELDNIKAKLNAGALDKSIKQNAAVPRYF